MTRKLMVLATRSYKTAKALPFNVTSIHTHIEAVSDYFLTVLAGLAGSTHMVSATLLALSRLVYEFHGKSSSLSRV